LSSYFLPEKSSFDILNQNPKSETNQRVRHSKEFTCKYAKFDAHMAKSSARREHCCAASVTRNVPNTEREIEREKGANRGARRWRRAPRMRERAFRAFDISPRSRLSAAGQSASSRRAGSAG